MHSDCTSLFIISTAVDWSQSLMSDTEIKLMWPLSINSLMISIGQKYRLLNKMFKGLSVNKISLCLSVCLEKYTIFYLFCTHVQSETQMHTNR